MIKTICFGIGLLLGVIIGKQINKLIEKRKGSDETD